jgi:hypothetical protein
VCTSKSGTGNEVYIEEAGIWAADIHASFGAYYSQASGYLGGF